MRKSFASLSPQTRTGKEPTVGRAKEEGSEREGAGNSVLGCLWGGRGFAFNVIQTGEAVLERFSLNGGGTFGSILF